MLRQGFLPDNGDEVWLDVGGTASRFNVVRRGDKFTCHWLDHAHLAPLRVDAEDLRFHEVLREGFYGLVAADLGCTPRQAELAEGIWQVGTLAIPGRGKAMVVVVEPGADPVGVFTLQELTQFKLVLVLWAGPRRKLAKSEGKTILQDDLGTSGDGLTFSCAAVNEMEHVAVPGRRGSRVDLDESPPLLVVGDRDFTLPVNRMSPTDGSRYLDHLFQNPGKAISCWDLYREIHPEPPVHELGEIAGNHEPEQEDPGDDKEEAGTRRRRTQAGGNLISPEWSEDVLDEKAKLALRREIEQKEAALAAARKAKAPAKGIKGMESELNSLHDYARKATGIGGRSRQIAAGHREKARQNVRKALAKVVAHVAKQDTDTGKALKLALGEGDPVTFNQPPDWGV